MNTVFTAEHFLLVVQNGQGKVTSFKKFSSNFIYLQVKCTFLDRPEKRLPEGPVFSCQGPQKKWKLTKIFRNYFSSKCSNGHVEYTIDNPIGKNWQIAKTSLLKVRRRKKKFKTFFRKTYLSNCSCKHVERSSGIPASIFSTKGRKFFAQCQEMIRKLDRISDIPNGKSSTECRKGLAQCAKKTSQKHPMLTWKAVFTTLLKNFRPNFETFLLISEKDKNTYIFFKKNKFLPGFPVDT